VVNIVNRRERAARLRRDATLRGCGLSRRLHLHPATNELRVHSRRGTKVPGCFKDRPVVRRSTML
jgi:hypothetical protein